MSTTQAALAELQLVYANQDWTGVGDAGGLRGSVAAGSLWASLHTADPRTGSGLQDAFEAAYTPYLRIAVARAPASWTFVAGPPTKAILQIQIQWAAATSGAPSPGIQFTHAALGLDQVGAGIVVAVGQFVDPLTVEDGGFPPTTPPALLEIVRTAT